MLKVFNKNFIDSKKEISAFIANFQTNGTVFGNQDRNAIKLFKLYDMTVNVKSFKVPNLINKIAYRFFRKSKAQRSFEYANALIDLGIGTPQPIAYFQDSSLLFFKDSYYVSEHLEADLTFRELVTNPKYPNHETILRAFVDFTFKLHEKGVLFLDHSPGNTLIKKVGDSYNFYLVDLNRMVFKSLTFDDRMQNFARLTPKKEMIAIMSNQYAQLIDKDSEVVFKEMWNKTSQFQEKFYRKKRLKQKWLGKK